MDIRTETSYGGRKKEEYRKSLEDKKKALSQKQQSLTRTTSACEQSKREQKTREQEYDRQIELNKEMMAKCDLAGQLFMEGKSTRDVRVSLKEKGVRYTGKGLKERVETARGIGKQEKPKEQPEPVKESEPTKEPGKEPEPEEKPEPIVLPGTEPEEPTKGETVDPEEQARLWEQLGKEQEEKLEQELKNNGNNQLVKQSAISRFFVKVKASFQKIFNRGGKQEDIEKQMNNIVMKATRKGAKEMGEYKTFRDKLVVNIEQKTENQVENEQEGQILNNAEKDLEGR